MARIIESLSLQTNTVRRKESGSGGVVASSSLQVNSIRHKESGSGGVVASSSLQVNSIRHKESGSGGVVASSSLALAGYAVNGVATTMPPPLPPQGVVRRKPRTWRQ